MPLSDIKVRNLKAEKKPYKVSDFEGLFVLIKTSGSKLWRFKYRVDGKEKLHVIGDYPVHSLARARKARDAAKTLLAQGIEPNEAKQEEKRIREAAQGETFTKLGHAFLAKQRKEGKSKATLDKTEYHLKLANQDFGHRPITEITAPMILKALRKVEAKGNYETAHRLRARIGSVFRYGVASGVAELDPTYALRDALIRPTRVHRAAITDPKALGQLMREIEHFEGQATTRIGLQLLAMLAQRPGEIRNAKWQEFDFANKVWAIPAEKIKMRRDHLAPLPDQAINLLDELRRMNGNGEYLFPSTAIHTDFKQGQHIKIGRPRNNFPLGKSIAHTVLFAGGIGITPMLNMAYALEGAGASWEVHYCGRAADRLAFTTELERFGDKVHIHIDADPKDQHLDINAVLGMTAPDRHLYVCGPNGFMDFVVTAAEQSGWDAGCVHLERFGAEVNTDGAPFNVVAQKSGKSFDVQPGETIAQKIEENGIHVQVSCQSGVCGTCLTRVIDGMADHRDLVQTELEKAANAQITVCCSRSKTKKLVLDI